MQVFFGGRNDLLLAPLTMPVSHDAAGSKLLAPCSKRPKRAESEVQGAGCQKTVPGNKGQALLPAAGSKLLAPCSKRPRRAGCGVPGAGDDMRRRSLGTRKSRTPLSRFSPVRSSGSRSQRPNEEPAERRSPISSRRPRAGDRESSRPGSRGAAGEHRRGGRHHPDEHGKRLRCVRQRRWVDRRCSRSQNPLQQSRAARKIVRDRLESQWEES